MKNLEELYKKIDESPMSVLGARPGMLMPNLLSSVIIKLGIDDGRKVKIYMKGNTEWMTAHILSSLSKISFKKTEAFLEPLSSYKYELRDDEKESLIQSIEILSKSGIVIEDLYKYEEDYTEKIIEVEKNDSADIIVIYELEKLFEKSHYSPKEILEMLSNLTKCGSRVVLVTKVERKAEKQPVQKFENIHDYNDIKNFVDLSLIIHKKTIDKDGNSRAIVTTDFKEFEITCDRDTEILEDYANRDN